MKKSNQLAAMANELKACPGPSVWANLSSERSKLARCLPLSRPTVFISVLQADINTFGSFVCANVRRERRKLSTADTCELHVYILVSARLH